MASRIREMFTSNEDPIHRVNYAELQPRPVLDSRISNHYAYKQHHHGPLPVVELRVPMCCEKCKEKVQEELEDLEGVRTVVCDQFHQRVTVAGYVDPLKVLKKVKKVKKKSEFFTQGSYINRTASPIAQAHGPHRDAGTQTGQNSLHQDSVRHDSVRHIGQPSLHRDAGPYTGQNSLHRDSVRHDSVRNTGQPSLHRDSVAHVGQPSLHQASVRYADQVSGHRDSVRYAGQAQGHGGSVRYAGQPMVHGGPGLTPRLTRTNSFERGLSRQPSFGKVTHYDGLRHHDFETRDLHRDYYGIRRMPSFKKHRYHDAEYVSMGDELMPQFGETHYTRSEQPMLQSQVSFSKLPARNPHYVQPAYHEY